MCRGPWENRRAVRWFWLRHTLDNIIKNMQLYNSVFFLYTKSPNIRIKLIYLFFLNFIFLIYQFVYLFLLSFKKMVEEDESAGRQLAPNTDPGSRSRDPCLSDEPNQIFFLRFHVCFLLYICIIVFLLLSHPHPNLARGFCSVRKKIREYKTFMVGRFSLILFEGALLAACSCLCSNSCFGKCFWDCRDFLLVFW